MVEMGIIDPSVYPDAPNEAHRPWADEKNQQWEAANMAAHAAMVDCVDLISSTDVSLLLRVVTSVSYLVQDRTIRLLVVPSV